MYIKLGLIIIGCVYLFKTKKYFCFKVVNCLLLCLLIIQMIVTYYVQPYSLPEMLLGYKFVPIE
ncbi:MAG: hypothetical protein IJ529_00210 [Alphaproteobacteria bacterium]|nr:hypothetical protein [Alphaproteobacteria bacterium]